MHAKAKFKSTQFSTDEEMIFELRNSEVNRKIGSSLRLVRQSDEPEKQGFIVFICRGDEHVRVRLITDIKTGGGHTYDRYID